MVLEIFSLNFLCEQRGPGVVAQVVGTCLTSADLGRSVV